MPEIQSSLWALAENGPTSNLAAGARDVGEQTAQTPTPVAFDYQNTTILVLARTCRNMPKG